MQLESNFSSLLFLTASKNKFSIKYISSKCDQICSFLKTFLWLVHKLLKCTKPSNEKLILYTNHCVKYRNFQNVCRNAQFPQSFRRIAETLQKLFVFINFSHQEIRWNYYILCSEWSLTYLWHQKQIEQKLVSNLPLMYLWETEHYLLW